jgi:hypothetical protein
MRLFSTRPGVFFQTGEHRQLVFHRQPANLCEGRYNRSGRSIRAVKVHS